VTENKDLDGYTWTGTYEMGCYGWGTGETTPEVTTDSANNISTVGAGLWGTLTDDGNLTTNCWFQYDTLSNLSTCDSTTKEETPEGNWFFCEIGDLESFTWYYFRACAENDSGRVYGVVDSFKTLPTTILVQTKFITYTTDRKMGILTDTPSEKLEVNGNVKADTFKGHFKGLADSATESDKLDGQHGSYYLDNTKDTIKSGNYSSLTDTLKIWEANKTDTLKIKIRPNKVDSSVSSNNADSLNHQAPAYYLDNTKDTIKTLVYGTGDTLAITESNKIGTAKVKISRVEYADSSDVSGNTHRFLGHIWSWFKSRFFTTGNYTGITDSTGHRDSLIVPYATNSATCTDKDTITGMSYVTSTAVLSTTERNAGATKAVTIRPDSVGKAGSAGGVVGDSVTASIRSWSLGGLTASQFLRSDVVDTGKYVSFDSLNVNKIRGNLIGNVTRACTTITSNYTTTDRQSIIFCNVTGNNDTLFLPTAVGIAGREYIVKLIGTGTIVMFPLGAQTIDGEAFFLLSLQYDCNTIVSDNANWYIIIGY